MCIALDTGLTLLFLALRRTDLDSTGLLAHLSAKQACMPRKSSFLALLFLRLTRPLRVADPCWALTAIAETCFRGRVGQTPEDRRTTDHELLGRLVADTARNPDDRELRRRLEGSLHAFIAAADNLQPYFDEDLLSEVVKPARQVLGWLRLPLPTAILNTRPVHDLNVSMQDRASWDKFARTCHMTAGDFAKEMTSRLTELRAATKGEAYKDVELEVDVKPEVQGCCLMTHIPRLVAFLSNIALEPVKQVKPSGASRLVIKPSASEHPLSLTIDIFTRFGSAQTARAKMAESSKLAHSLEDLKRFGVIFAETPRVHEDAAAPLGFSLRVPVGFKPNTI